MLVGCAQPGLYEFLARGPASYAWSETVGGEPIDHRGGIIFFLQGERVLSRAWFTRAATVRPWPAVGGVGTIQGNSLHVVYRNASGHPEHDFYHAYGRFEFDPKDWSFRCTFSQKVDKDPASPLAQGSAYGTRIVEPSPEYERHLESLRTPVKVGAKVGCAVLPQNQAFPELTAEYRGKHYRFCCSSCLQVFLNGPETFSADR